MSCHFEASIEGSNRNHGFLQDVSKDLHAPTRRHEDGAQAIWSRERRSVRCLQTVSDSGGCGCVNDHRSNALTRTPQGPHFQAIQRVIPKMDESSDILNKGAGGGTDSSADEAKLLAASSCPLLSFGY